MSITTFDELIKKPDSHKIYLVEIEPNYRVLDWTLYSGSIYYSELVATEIAAIKEDGSELTEVDSIDDITAGDWYHGKDKIYLECTSGLPHSKVVIAELKKNYATEDKIFSDDFYEGIVLSIPVIKQKKNELYYGVSAISSGKISLANKSGSLDSIYKKFAWNNRPITILLGGEDLPYSEYKSMFSGPITDKHLSTGMLDFKYEDNKSILEDDIPINTFDQTTYPNLETEDVGRPIALIYGSVFKVPAVCTTAALGSSTSLHSFKICDTSVCSLSEISNVYVNDSAVSFQSSSVATASFKLATSTYTVGDTVTVTVTADEDNPIEQIKSIASNVVSIPYDSDNYNTATVSLAVTEADVYKCGTYIGETQSFLEVIGDLMVSCMGSFFNDNNGKYSIKIWDVEVEDDITQVDYNQISDDSFDTDAKIETIRNVVKVGWRKAWGKDTYSYKQQTTSDTEALYGVSKSKTITTNISDEISAKLLQYVPLLFLFI